jgi:hypothetical protein
MALRVLQVLQVQQVLLVMLHSVLQGLMFLQLIHHSHLFLEILLIVKIMLSLAVMHLA